jgi:hypothetical protein
MPERDQENQPKSPPMDAPRRGDESNVPQDPQVGRSRGTEENTEGSTPSRPHGTTEDPDRTL